MVLTLLVPAYLGCSWIKGRYMNFLSVFCVFGNCVPVLIAFVVFDLVSSVQSQEIGWEEHL